MKKIVIAVLIWGGLASLCSAASATSETKEKHLTAFELLDRYAANQNKLRSIIAKTEETIINTQSNRPTPKFTRWGSELRTNGKRTLWRFYRWLDLPAEDALTPLEDAHYYHFFLWDGKSYFEYNKNLKSNEAHVFISADEREAKYILNHAYNGAPFLGLRFSDSKRIDAVLRQADSVSVRDELEQIGPVSCYVIDAKAKSGNYTVWLDPEHGYNIAKADVRVVPNDLYLGKRLKNNESESLSIKNVLFRKIKGPWIPMEADSYSTSNRQDGPTVHATIHHKITQIILNPNHEVLSSFVPEMENGTNVHLDSGAEYTWQDGMKFVVDERDGNIRYVPKEWSILVGVGKPLPKLEGIKLKLSAQQTKNRSILLCFFDMQQRPSRNCIRELAKRAEELKEKGVAVIAVQASKVDENELNEWVKKYNIPFPVGMVQGDEEKTRFAWGVRSLPWLILTDSKHIVHAEGFAPAELDEKISAIAQKQN